ncbi:MAG: EAL domain-containing protein [Myxococcota bacterium]
MNADSVKPSYQKILVVDDSPSTRLFARASIAHLGLAMVEAATGAEALAAFEQDIIGLVLLDVGLPDMDGFEVASRIRKNPKGALTPIIMLTGKDDVESIQRAFDVGATDFASKPVSGLILGQRLLFALEAARRQKEIESQKLILEVTQKHAQIGRWSFDPEDRRLEMSDSAREIFDLPTGDALFPTIVERTSKHERKRLFPAIQSVLDSPEGVEIKHFLRDSAGRERVVYTHARRDVSSHTGNVRIEGYSQEITARERVERKARYLAQHDHLTGLKNQEFFRESLELTIAKQSRNETKTALLLLNLDHFSRINDLRGRDLGDLILRKIAKRLVQSLRSSDLVAAGIPVPKTIARVGADEFSVLLSEVSEPADVARICVRLLEFVHEPIEVEGERINVSGRIGIAISPDDGENAGDLIANAEAAGRHAREGSGTHFEFYRSTMNESARERLGLESDFRESLDRDEIMVNFQPRVEMSTGIVIGAEALARWNHHELGFISPEVFVQLAEEAGLTFEFGRHIIQTTLSQMRAWIDSGYNAVGISINVSPTLLIDERLPGLFQEAMSTYGIDSSLVEIEITETVLIRREKDAAVALGKLKSLGLSIALDDFGTGYSALTHLQYFPVDVIKIDRSFVIALSDERGRAIVRGVISMAHAMGLRVVAEGVETLEQRAFLAEANCDEEQGYLVSRPVPAAEFEALFWPQGMAPILSAEFGIDDD